MKQSETTKTNEQEKETAFSITAVLLECYVLNKCMNQHGKITVCD